LDYSLILFFSVEGVRTILPTSFSFFLFSTGGSGQTDKPWKNVEAVRSWIYGSHSFGHRPYNRLRPVGDLVRQVAPPSQQANLDVIMSG